MQSVLALQDTTIKRSYLDSSSISNPADKFELPEDEKLAINWYKEAPENHWEFELVSPKGGFYNWFAYRPHVSVKGDPLQQQPPARANSQITAFLDTIAWCEGTDRVIDDGIRSGYNIQYTYKTFSDFSDHPRQVNCSGGLCSDAAGRYQFLASTWDMVVGQINLPNFEPANQDLGAIQLIENRGAIADIEAGNVRAACDKLSWEWASLPPGRYGQPIISYEQCEDLFQQAGGRLA